MWALKAAHPNGEEVTASAGIPDHTNVPVITPEFRSNFTIVGEMSGIGNDDIDVIVLPVSELAFMYRRYPAGTPMKPYASWKFVFYPAVTVQTNAFTGKDSDDKDVEYQYFTTSLNDYGRTRAMYNGITAHLDAPALSDQGRIVAGQLPFENRDGVYTGTYYKSSTDPAGSVTRNTLPSNMVSLPSGFPFTESTLFQATPGAVVWEAREGVYMPMRFKEPVHLFEADRMETMLVAYDEGNPHGIQGTAEGFSDTVARNLALGVPNNLLAGIILFRGVARTANVNIKTRIGLESLVETSSIVSPFQHASPVLDRMAIDQVTRLSQASPMAYPAEYNDFSSILATIKNVLSNIVKPIAGTLSGLGIPIVSDVAGIGHNILGNLGLSQGRRRRTRRGGLDQLGAGMSSGIY